MPDAQAGGRKYAATVDHLLLLKEMITRAMNQKKDINTLREESSQTNVILQYKLLAAILSAVCSVIQQL